MLIGQFAQAGQEAVRGNDITAFALNRFDQEACHLIRMYELMEEHFDVLEYFIHHFVKLTEAQAKKFYEVHAERPFYGELVSQMIAEPVVVQVLEGDNAVAKYREVMGATNPNDAAEGTIRKLFALSIGENSVHGSDSLENAGIEIAQFFDDAQIPG